MSVTDDSDLREPLAGDLLPMTHAEKGQNGQQGGESIGAGGRAGEEEGEWESSKIKTRIWMIPMVRHGVFGSTLQQGFTRQPEARGCLTAVKKTR